MLDAFALLAKRRDPLGRVPSFCFFLPSADAASPHDIPPRFRASSTHSANHLTPRSVGHVTLAHLPSQAAPLDESPDEFPLETQQPVSPPRRQALMPAPSEDPPRGERTPPRATTTATQPSPPSASQQGAYLRAQVAPGLAPDESESDTSDEDEPSPAAVTAVGRAAFAASDAARDPQTRGLASLATAVPPMATEDDVEEANERMTPMRRGPGSASRGTPSLPSRGARGVMATDAMRPTQSQPPLVSPSPAVGVMPTQSQEPGPPAVGVMPTQSQEPGPPAVGVMPDQSEEPAMVLPTEELRRRARGAAASLADMFSPPMTRTRARHGRERELSQPGGLRVRRGVGGIREAALQASRARASHVPASPLSASPHLRAAAAVAAAASGLGLLESQQLGEEEEVSWEQQRRQREEEAVRERGQVEGTGGEGVLSGAFQVASRLLGAMPPRGSEEATAVETKRQESTVIASPERHEETEPTGASRHVSPPPFAQTIRKRRREMVGQWSRLGAAAVAGLGGARTNPTSPSSVELFPEMTVTGAIEVASGAAAHVVNAPVAELRSRAFGVQVEADAAVAVAEREGNDRAARQASLVTVAAAAAVAAKTGEEPRQTILDNSTGEDEEAIRIPDVAAALLCSRFHEKEMPPGEHRAQMEEGGTGDDFIQPPLAAAASLVDAHFRNLKKKRRLSDPSSSVPAPAAPKEARDVDSDTETEQVRGEWYRGGDTASGPEPVAEECEKTASLPLLQNLFQEPSHSTDTEGQAPGDDGISQRTVRASTQLQRVRRDQGVGERRDRPVRTTSADKDAAAALLQIHHDPSRASLGNDSRLGGLSDEAAVMATGDNDVDRDQDARGTAQAVAAATARPAVVPAEIAAENQSGLHAATAKAAEANLERRSAEGSPVAVNVKHGAREAHDTMMDADVDEEEDDDMNPAAIFAAMGIKMSRIKNTKSSAALKATTPGSSSRHRAPSTAKRSASTSSKPNVTRRSVLSWILS